MVCIGTSLKVFIAISLVSLLVFSVNLTKQTYETLIGYLTGNPTWVNYVNRIGLVFWGGLIGVTARIAAVILGLFSLFLVWKTTQPFFKVKRLVTASLILESIYFLGLLPSVYFLRRTPFFATAYLLQVLFAVPFLVILAFKVLNYQSELRSRLTLWKWGAAAFAAYVAALWANSVLRWFDMVSVAGLEFLLTGIRAVGFLSSIILMSLALAFAIVAVLFLTKQRKNSAVTWAALSLMLIGLQFVIYVVYSLLSNVVASLDLVDVWTVPLLGLGVAMFLNGRRAK